MSTALAATLPIVDVARELEPSLVGEPCWSTLAAALAFAVADDESSADDESDDDDDDDDGFAHREHLLACTHANAARVRVLLVAALLLAPTVSLDVVYVAPTRASASAFLRRVRARLLLEPDRQPAPLITSACYLELGSASLAVLVAGGSAVHRACTAHVVIVDAATLAAQPALQSALDGMCAVARTKVIVLA